SLASLRRFWAVAASRNSSLAPVGPRNRNRLRPMMCFRCANSISIFLPARPLIKHCADQHADDISGLFEDAPRDFADRLFRTALALHWAWRAIELTGAVENLIVADDRAARGQRLCRWANVDVPRFVEPEVGSGECSIIAPGFVPDRNVGRDALRLDD